MFIHLNLIYNLHILQNRKGFFLPKRLAGFQHSGFREQPFGIVVFPDKLLGIFENGRDIVELYSGHMHHLREQVNGVPEPETRRLYERLVEGRLNRVLVER